MKLFGALLVAACCGAACHSTIVFDPPPTDENTGSMVLFASSENNGELAFATSPGDGEGVFDPPLPALANVEALSLTAALYTCALSELELAEGPLELGDPVTALSAPRAIYRHQDDGWSASPDEASLFDRLPWRSACADQASVERDNSGEPIDDDGRLFAAFGNDDVLALTKSGHVALFSNGVVLGRVPTATVTPEELLSLPDGRVAFIEPNGRIFLVAHEDALAPDRWEKLDVAFEPTDRLIIDLVGVARPKQGAIELLVATNASTLEYFDGDRWTRLLQPTSESTRLQVAFKDENEAAVIGVNGPFSVTFVHLPAKTVEVETVEGVPDNCLLSAVSYVDALGWVFGTCDLFIIGGRAYAADVGAQVLFIRPLSASAIFVSGHDGYVLFDGERPECLERLTPVDAYGELVVRHSRGVTWIGGLAQSRAFTFIFHPPTRDRPSCQVSRSP